MTGRGNSSRRKKNKHLGREKRTHRLTRIRTPATLVEGEKNRGSNIDKGGLKESARVHNNKHGVITQPTLVTRLSAPVNTHPLLCISFANTEF